MHKPDPNTHLMIDIEALGLRPGAAVIQLSAQFFDPTTGDLGTAFNTFIKPKFPFTVDPETLDWHKEKGTYPHEHQELPTVCALFEFGKFLSSQPSPSVFWSWGSTYDFPLLQAVYDAHHLEAPWKYYQCQCARTVFKTILGIDAVPTSKPHDAAEDVRIQIKDLMLALKHIFPA